MPVKKGARRFKKSSRKTTPSVEEKMPEKKVILEVETSQDEIEISSVPVIEEAVEKKEELRQEEEVLKDTLASEEATTETDTPLTEVLQDQVLPTEDLKPDNEVNFLFSQGLNETEEEKGSVSKDKPRKKTLPLILAFILGILLGGLVMFLLKPGDFGLTLDNKTAEKGSSEQQPTPTAVPTEIPVDLEKYSISILNGSETKGGAAKLQESLEAEGFIVAGVGNASGSAYEETEIKAKKEVDQAYLDKLRSFLAKEFTLATTEELADSQKTDIVIIIGGKAASTTP